MDIGERIRALRFQRGMTQADVAGNGLSRSYISSLEHGRFIPSEKALAIIAANLGVSVNVLIGRDQPRETSQTVRRLLRTVRLSRSVSLREQVGLLKLATHVAKSSGDTLLLAEAYEETGDFYYRHEELHEAAQAYSQALSCQWEGTSTPGSRRARIELKLGHSLFDSGEFVTALLHYRNAQRILEQTGSNGALLVKALRNLGNVRCRLGSFEQALLDYTESRKLAEGLRDPIAAAHAVLGISYALLALGRAHEAYSAAREAEQRYIQQAHEAGATAARHNMAAAGIALGKYAESERLLRAAIELYQAQGEPEKEAAAFEELARLKEHQGDVASAVEQCHRGLAVVDNRRQSVAWCRLIAQLGLLEVKQGHMQLGVEHVWEATEGFVQSGAAHEIARLLERVLHLAGWKEVEA